MQKIYILYGQYKEEPKGINSIHKTLEGAKDSKEEAEKYCIYDMKVYKYFIESVYLED